MGKFNVVNLALRLVSLPRATSDRLVAIDSVRSPSAVGREEPDDTFLSRRSVLGIVWPGRADLRRSGPDGPILALDDSVPPESFETVWRQVRIAHRVRDVLVTEVVLQ
jgi:hypothetical protein